MTEQERTSERAFCSRSVTDTEAYFAALGAALRDTATERAVVVGFSGPLGAGKTHAVRGLVTGVDSAVADWVSSPTYAVMQVYPGEVPITHLDVYRLTGIDDVESVGFWDVLEEPGVVAIEWPSRVQELLDCLDLHVSLERSAQARRITVRGTSEVGLRVLTALR